MRIRLCAFSQHSQFGPACRKLLERIDRGDISGLTSTHVLAETAHRLMTLEACTVFGWPFAGIAQRLRRHHVELRQLSAYRQAVDQILNSQIQVVSTLPENVLAAIDVSRQHGLLGNDALIVAVMQVNGLTSIASHDADFDRVPGLMRYTPA
jgi:predicted nucleic acid-binding protein